MDPHFIMMLLKACEESQITLEELEEIARRMRSEESSLDTGPVEKER